MSKNFPHLSDTAFPNFDNVNVFRYKNVFDYTRWIPNTKIKLVNVNYDNDYQNVVKFNDDNERDSYFNTIVGETITLISDLRLQQNVIKLPIPFDVMNRYNYLIVDFPIATSDGEKINYENVNGKHRFFYFINSITPLAPNTTKCELQLDIWTTFINDAEFNYFMLERGHAPMFKASNVVDFLSNPIENNDYLLHDDIDFGDASKVAKTENIIFNDADQMVCIATTANPQGNWGSRDSNWQVPVKNWNIESGLPTNIVVFAINEDDAKPFFTNMNSSVPQFAQTIQAIYLLPKKLLSFDTSFTFCSTTCYKLSYNHKLLDTIKLSKDMFDYDNKYSNITKLYTFPYAHIEISDANGNTSTIKIEDTGKGVGITAAASFAFPYVDIQAIITGVGSSGRSSLKFKNLTEHTYYYGGKWYDLVFRWNIPVYAFTQSAEKHYDYNTYYERNQTALAIDTEYDNAIDYARAAWHDKTSDTSLLDVKKDISILKNNELFHWRRSQENMSRAHTNFINVQTTRTDNELSTMSFQNSTYSKLATADVSGFLIDNIFGASSLAVSIGTNNVIGYATRFGNNNVFEFSYGGEVKDSDTAVSPYQLAALYTPPDDYYQGFQGNSLKEQNTFISDITKVTNQNTKIVRDNDYHAVVGGKSEHSIESDTTDNNLVPEYGADYEGTATRNRDTGKAGIQAGIDDAGIDKPIRFGTTAYGETAQETPMGLFVNIITEKPDEIAQAGDYFLRYGYACNRVWEVDNLNLCKHFTYWKATDLWLNGFKGIIENVQESLKDIFKRGVTIWRNNDDIGAVSIYDN